MELRKCLRKSDSGSGTVLGVMLVLAISVVCYVILCAGSYLICSSKAHSISEHIALSVAQELSMYELSLPDGDQVQTTMNARVKAFGRHLCNQAEGQLIDADFTMKSCEIEGLDVQVSIQGTPSVSFLPHPIRVSRAGPAQCVPRNR